MTVWINIMPNGRYAIMASQAGMRGYYQSIAAFDSLWEAQAYARRERIVLAKIKKPKDTGAQSRPPLGAIPGDDGSRHRYNMTWDSRKRRWRYQKWIPVKLQPIVGRVFHSRFLAGRTFDEAKEEALECAQEYWQIVKAARIELAKSTSD